MTFRLILQPLVAATLAIKAGLLDAKTGRPAYGWTILTSPTDRAALLVAFLLACVPYLLIRGPVNRLAHAGRQHRHA